MSELKMMQGTLILLVILAGFNTSQSASSNTFGLSAAAAPPVFEAAKTFAVNTALFFTASIIRSFKSDGSNCRNNF
uniref:Putative secreted protein n=1 Tax=Panstrongylus lignarius TaxID=156445 RepID=A0A224XTI3_9HEMI